MPQFRQMLGEILGIGVDSIPRVTIADTVREAARFIGDRNIAVAAAKRVLELIDASDFSVSLPDGTYEEMRRDAVDEVEQGLKPVAGYPLTW